MCNLQIDQVHEYIVLLEEYYVFQKDLLFEKVQHQVNHKHEQHFLFIYRMNICTELNEQKLTKS
jgi:hypothetical protein